MMKKLVYALPLICMLILGVHMQAKAEGEKEMVKLETTMGDIVIELNAEKAPLTTENFLQYVKDGFYDGLIFHRVIDNFMIQGGGFDKDMKQINGRAPIKNEADNGLANEKYTIAMARTPEPHSASSQFFINTKDNSFLNFTSPNPSGWGYAVFGEVIAGKEVVDAISVVPTTSSGFHGDVPVKPIIILKATIVE